MYISSMPSHPISSQFRNFLVERPAISPDRLAEELGMHRANLQKIIKGSRQIPQAKRGLFISIMKKYGFNLEEETSSK